MMCEDPGGLTWKATVGAPDAVRIKHPLRRRCKCGMCTDLATGLLDLYFKYCEHLFFGSSSACQDLKFRKKKNPEGLLDESDFFLQISSLATLHKSKWGCHFVQQLVLFTQPFRNISADRKAYSATLLQD